MLTGRDCQVNSFKDYRDLKCASLIAYRCYLSVNIPFARHNLPDASRIPDGRRHETPVLQRRHRRNGDCAGVINECRIFDQIFVRERNISSSHYAAQNN